MALSPSSGCTAQAVMVLCQKMYSTCQEIRNLVMSAADSDDMEVRQLLCMTCVLEKWTLQLHCAFSVFAFAAYSLRYFLYSQLLKH